jgi:phosphate starvation-inducible PhoH-like protein
VGYEKSSSAAPRWKPARSSVSCRATSRRRLIPTCDLYDALNDILDYDQVKRYLEREIIEILPLAYMRGRTLNNSFIILDEGQNTSVSQMKMFLTRMGTNSRIVVNGDITQLDLPDDMQSGLIHARRIIRDIPGISWVELERADIVRHPW